MEFNNDVFQVLMTNATGKVKNATSDGTQTSITALANGELGIYDAETNKTVVTYTTAPASYTTTHPEDIPNAFYFANKFSEGIARSAGQWIEKNNILSICVKKSAAEVKQNTVLDLGTISLTSEESSALEVKEQYGLRLGFQNARIHRLIGMTPFTKSFITGTHKIPASVSSANLAAYKFACLLHDFVTAINADGDGLVKATVMEMDTTPAAVTDTSISGIFTAITTSSNNFTIYLEGNSINEYNFSDVNRHYYKDRVTTFSVHLISGFAGDAVVNYTTSPAVSATPSVGDGYDLKQMEYRAGGWNGKPGPYRSSELLGLARDGFVYHANPDGYYTMFEITYKKKAVSGWQTHDSICTTVIGIYTDTAGSFPTSTGANDTNKMINFFKDIAALPGVKSEFVI